MEIYLDNSATTPLSSSARRAMDAALDAVYGNPSSLHSAGLAAEKLVSAARKAVLSSLGVRHASPRQLIFTAGGTEANNLALFGTVRAKKRTGRERIILSAGEHASVEACASKLEEEGFAVVRIPTTGGRLDLDALRSALNENVILVSLMLVNNETGAHYAIGDAFTEVKRLCPGAVTHCDAVQGYAKVPVSPRILHADMITVSAHKIHGPKGVGALYVDEAVLRAKKLVPVLLGGGQENGLRSGTENVPAITGFGAAAEEVTCKWTEDAEKMAALRRYFLDAVRTRPPLQEIMLNLPETSAPHIINLTLPGIKSETMLHYLSGRGIYVSSGSACSSHGHQSSRALTAFGLTPKQADSSIRISLSAANTREELDACLDALAEGIGTLVRIS